MQPADVFATDVFAAVAGTIRRHQPRCKPGRVNRKLLLAAALQRDKPERGGFDAVATGGNQAVVLVDRRLDAPESVGDPVAGLYLDRHLAGVVADHHMVFKKRRRILRDGFELFAKRCKSHTMHRVRMTHRDDIGVLLMHRRMKYEASPVDCMSAFDDLPVVVGKDQIRHLDLRKMHRHRIGPVEMRMLGVSHRQMTGEAVIEALIRKRAARADQPLFQVPALLGHV